MTDSDELLRKAGWTFHGGGYVTAEGRWPAWTRGGRFIYRVADDDWRLASGHGDPHFTRHSTAQSAMRLADEQVANEDKHLERSVR